MFVSGCHLALISSPASGVDQDGVVPDAVVLGDAFADADGAVAGGVVQAMLVRFSVKITVCRDAPSKRHDEQHRPR